MAVTTRFRGTGEADPSGTVPFLTLIVPKLALAVRFWIATRLLLLVEAQREVHVRLRLGDAVAVGSARTSCWADSVPVTPVTFSARETCPLVATWPGELVRSQVHERPQLRLERRQIGLALVVDLLEGAAGVDLGERRRDGQVVELGALFAGRRAAAPSAPAR